MATSLSSSTSPLEAPSVPMTTSAVEDLHGGKREVPIAIDGNTYLFHAMWLRDADDANIVEAAGERLLKRTPVGPLARVDPSDIRAVGINYADNDDSVEISWNDATDISSSVFDMEFLRKYKCVAKEVADSNTPHKSTTDEVTTIDDWNDLYNIPKWLEPYTGYPDAPAPFDFHATNQLWDKSKDQHTFCHFDHSGILNDRNMHMQLIRELLTGDGVALIDNVPPDESDKAIELNEFIRIVFGGLQKDPSRSERNWKIVHRPEAASISYDPQKWLYQHTDSSIPPHGIPALLLSMHYVEGYGANTLTDGYSVANILRNENPEGYHLLTKYGYDGERDFAASRMDSIQEIAKGLVVHRKHPIFVENNNGNGLQRLQYNEVFRKPSSVPFDIFPEWFKAFSRFVDLIHEHAVTVDMKENTILLMNNWRVLHGRAGNRASPNRHVVGGTILRENIYSTAMQMTRIIRDNDDDDN